MNGPEVHLKLSTVLAEEDIKSEKITGLVVCGMNKSTDIKILPSHTYTRDIIPARPSQIPRPKTAHNYKWPHLRRIADNLMLHKEEADVALLLGINVIKSREIIPGDNSARP